MKQQVVVGVDIGSWTFKISAFTNQQFQILTNQANFRETPSLIAFHETQRLVGEEAQNKLKSNYMNTVRAPLRLIGLQKFFDLIEQQLKCSPAKYDVGEELNFSIQLNKDKKSSLQPEHFLISLMSKIFKIVSSHNLNPIGYYLTIPSYLSHYQRKLIKRCGQIVLHSEKVVLIDDWLGLSSDYAYHRVSDLQNSTRVVIFVDIGYSKSSFFVIEFNQKEARLLDCQHMRFMGSKNMDHLLTEFYDKMLKLERNQYESIFNSQKLIVKMLDHIQKQRKVLSANEDSHLHVQSLFEDYDLSYNMKRGELEDIVGPVLSQIRKGLKNLKARMPFGFKIHSVELVGGASRMPFVSTLIKETFGIDPSRTLNLSEATARGATIYGAVTSNLIPLAYSLNNFNLVDICICWNSTTYNDIFFGQNQSQYTNKRIIFTANSHAPSQTFINLTCSGPVELYIYYSQTVSTKTIGYLRFSTPNRVYFKLDQSKIVEARLQKGSFTVCKMQDKKQAKWKDIQLWQQDIDILEQRIKLIYELKNQFEAKFYNIRSKLNQYKTFMNNQEEQTFVSQFKEIELWIQHQNNRALSSSEDLQLYTEQLKRLKSYEEAVNILKERQTKNIGLKGRYQDIREAIDSIPSSSLNQEQLKKIGQLIQWLKDSYTKMQENNWEGYYLNNTFLTFAEEETKRIVG